MRLLAIVLIFALTSACSHVSPSTETYDGIPFTRFVYENTVYRAYDVPASGRFLLSRSRESASNNDQHDIDAAARAYFSEIGRSQCLIIGIEEKGTDKWEVKYRCELQ